MASLNDRRTTPRAAMHDMLVKVEGYCLHRYGYAKDISSSGMRLRTYTDCESYAFDRETRIRVEFYLPEKDLEVSCLAEPVWHEQPIGGSISTMMQGVRFIEIDPAARKELDEWVKGRV